MLRTNGNALTAETALRVVNVGQVVLNGDRTEVTLLLTLTATDTTDGTSLHRHRALVLIDARDKHSPTLRALLAQFDDATRTSLDATAARRTLLLIDLGDTSLGIDMDGVELTSLDAITTTQTAEAAGRFTSTTCMHSSTRAKSGILGNARTMLASTITSHYGHHRLCIGNRHTKQISNLSHRIGTAHRTEQPVETACISTLDKSIGHTATSWESTSTTVGTRQHFADLSNTGIFIDSELLGGRKQHNCCYQTNSTQDHHCN